MKLEYHHLKKSALAAILFLAVYQLASLAFSGALWTGGIFLFSAIFAAYLLINEQLIPNQNHHTHYFFLLISAWIPIFLLLFAQGMTSHSFGVWVCMLIFCSFVLLKETRALRLNIFVLFIFWAFVLISKTSLSHIETGLALTLVMILMGIINQQVNSLHIKLDIAQKSDHITGCIQPQQFKFELDKAHQLYHRYGTPFSLISIQYHASFISELDLQTWLKEFAELYQSRLRKTDVFCRFNSHKFMILLPSTSKENATRLSEDLEKCAEAYQFNYLKTSAEYEHKPTLDFSVLNYSGDETSKVWLRAMQNNSAYPKI